MLACIVTISGFCLLLASFGWDTRKVSTCPCHVEMEWDSSDVYVQDPEAYNPVLGCCEEVGCDCGNWIFPCALCPGAVDLRNAWQVQKIIYRTSRAIKRAKRCFDNLPVDNSVWVALLVFTNGSLIVGLFGEKISFPGKVWGKSVRHFACQKNSNEYRKLKETKMKHRCELEQMAKTIEFLQTKYRRQANRLEKREFTMDLFRSDTSMYYRKSQTPRRGTKRENVTFEIPDQDLEWDL